MSDDVRTLYLISAVLVFAAMTLLYLSWRQQGEIELLHERVDKVDMRPVARILRARDDETAEAAAKGEQ